MIIAKNIYQGMYLYGAGHHAKVILEILALCDIPVKGVYDDTPEIAKILNYPVIKDMSLWDINDFIFISIGNNIIRKKIANKLHFPFATISHPFSFISQSAKIGVGTVLMAGVIINSSAIIGKHCILNTACSIDHDCNLGDYVHISPKVGLAGDIIVQEGAHIGIGATVIPGINIGKWAIIGAGTTVINDVPDYAVLVGNPGKIIRYNSIDLFE